MIKNNRIIFGLGSVLVTGNSASRRATFQHMQPAQEVGSDITEEILQNAVLLEKVEFKHGNDMKDFMKILSGVNEYNTVVEFRGYAFDFSEYNEKSVKTVKEAFNKAYFGWQLALAC